MGSWKLCQSLPPLLSLGISVVSRCEVRDASLLQPARASTASCAILAGEVRGHGAFQRGVFPSGNGLETGRAGLLLGGEQVTGVPETSQVWESAHPLRVVV